MLKLYKKYEEIINYLIIGVLSTFVSLAAYYILTLTILDPHKVIELQTANVVSWVIAVTFAYYTNKIYVFKKEKKFNLKEIISFYLSRVATLLIDMILMYIFVNKMNFDDKIIKLIVQVIVIIFNYILSKFIVFKKGKE